jgi:proteinaceous RNase P
VLHEGRYRETWDADAETGAWMDGLCASRRMYRTPPRMNDDLFWMYATIHAGEAGRLVRVWLCVEYVLLRLAAVRTPAIGTHTRLPTPDTQVSNDQMRDHVWSMLRPKHMLKWKERHVVRYAFNFPKTVFTAHPPCAYTPCVQQRAPGVWLLPSGDSDKRWLLCGPSGSS